MKLFALIHTILLVSLPHCLVQSFSIQGNLIRDLEGEGTNFIQETSSWQVTDKENILNQVYSTCGTTYLLGGAGVGSNDIFFGKNYTSLPPHDTIYFSFRASLIDGWNRQTSFVVLADKLEYAVGVLMLDSSENFLENKCGAANIKDLDNVRIFGKLKHSSSSLTLKIQKMEHSPVSSSIGFRDVTLHFKNATDEKKASKNELCGLASIPIPMSQCQCPEGKYQTWDRSCQPCDPMCKTCFGASSSECFDCANHAFFDGQECKITTFSESLPPVPATSPVIDEISGLRSFLGW